MARFDPPTNSKTSMDKDDHPGWYQITLVDDRRLVAKCYWWNGKRWHLSPHSKHGYETCEIAGIRGIVRLSEA